MSYAVPGSSGATRTLAQRQYQGATHHATASVPALLWAYAMLLPPPPAAHAACPVASLPPPPGSTIRWVSTGDPAPDTALSEYRLIRDLLLGALPARDTVGQHRTSHSARVGHLYMLPCICFGHPVASRRGVAELGEGGSGVGHREDVAFWRTTSAAAQSSNSATSLVPTPLPPYVQLHYLPSSNSATSLFPTPLPAYVSATSRCPATSLCPSPLFPYESDL
eukprot:3941502-Rhodomonas_salina.3